MKNRKLLLAALLFLSPPAALAQVSVAKANYSLSFAAHWNTGIIAAPDSNTAAVMDLDHEAAAWVHGVPAVPGMSADQYFASLTAVYRMQLTLTDSSDKQLGGKTFKTTGWKDLDSADEDDNSRLRIYSLSGNGLYFVAWMVYESPEGDPAVAEFEAALATLQFNSAGVGSRLRSFAAVPGPGRLDLLGRSRVASAGRTAHGVYLVRP